MIKAGDIVIPRRNLKATRDRYSVDDKMRDLVGQRIRVSDAYPDGHDSVTVIARGWSWHQKDLKIAPRRKAAR